MNEESIFLAAIEKTPPDERAAFLDEACSGDRELRARVEALITEHENPHRFLDGPLLRRGGDNQGEQPPMEQPGTVIGRYKLLEQIGEGGFGVVYMAEQLEPVRRKVALKIIKPGMDSKSVIARFESERQALAMMDHPNIAKVLDGGTTQLGRPYFVMELIQGPPITRFCDDNQLSPTERLKLFLPICSAIQHAHQKGLVHRDIKPSNLLVSLYDGQAVPKVIDFGVAKAIDQRLTEKTLFTQFGQMIGTLEYMSPEQAEPNQLDIDTRTDIYALGAVLYELLTGSPPFETKRLHAVAFAEMLRIIREEQPPRPSQRLSTAKEMAAISLKRKTDPAKLSRLLHGDLDWIVLKALDKQRARRYSSADGLAEDIHRYLASEPVEAGRPSTAYRLRKFAYKNRTGLAVALAFILLLCAGTVVSTWQAMRANAERDRAERNASESRRNLYIARIQQAQYEWEKNNIGRIGELLDIYRSPSSAEDDLRGWEWFYWDRMCHLDLRTLEGHAGPVNGVVFSPDGSQVASASDDGTVRIWETGTGHYIRSLDGHEGSVTAVAFHPDGRILASGGEDKTVRVWDVANGRQLRSLLHTQRVSSVAFSPNGKLLAVGTWRNDGDRRIWDASTGKLVHTLSVDPQKGVTSICFSPDGSRLICAGDPKIEIWDLSTAKLLPSLPGHPKPEDRNPRFVYMTAVVCSPDGNILATSSRDGTIKLWDLASGRELRTIRGHTSGVNRVAFGPDGHVLASASGDNSIKLWRVDTGEEIHTLRGHQGKVNHVSFSPDGLRIASGSVDGTVKIWDANRPTDLTTFITRGGGYMSAVLSHDGRLLAVAGFDGGGDDQWVEIRDLATSRRYCEIDGHNGSITAVAFSRDDRLLATASEDKTIKIWDVSNGNEIGTIPTEMWVILELAFSPQRDQLLAFGAEIRAESNTNTPTVRVWETNNGRLLHSFDATSAAFHPDEPVLALASVDEIANDNGRLRPSGQIKLLDLTSGEAVRRWKVDGDVRHLAFSPDGQYLAGTRRLRGNVSTATVWQAGSGSEISKMRDEGDFLFWSADGSRVFTNNNGNLKVWRAHTGDFLCETSSSIAGLTASQISADGLRIVNRAETIVTILDVSPSAEKIAMEHEARNLIANLLHFPLKLPPFAPVRKSDLRARIRQLKTISVPVQQRALELSEEFYTPREEALQYEASSYDVLHNIESTPQQYEQALEWARIAYELAPQRCVGTFGFALYRNGKYKEAITASRTAYELDSVREPRAIPLYVAIIAMAEFRLGQVTEARATLARVRDRKGDGRYAALPGNAEIVREATDLIERRISDDEY